MSDTIRELRELEQAATRHWDPWYQAPKGIAGSRARSVGREPNDDWGLFRDGPGYVEVDETTDTIGTPPPFTVADALLIAAMRSALPALLDIAEAAQRYRQTHDDNEDGLEAETAFFEVLSRLDRLTEETPS